ncbi:MAG TPA: ATP-binding protein [Bryobacteraceae bacterium]|nr:ATP-binding protein [Bryobacteraceae bacterium]
MSSRTRTPGISKPNPSVADPARPARRDKLLRTLLRYLICLAMLAIPAAITFALKLNPRFGPIISASYVATISVAAWWGGVWAGILVSCATVPVLTVVATSGKTILPPHLDPVGLSVLFFISILISRVAQNRKRIEQMLRSANEKLEQSVKERTAELERARTWLEITLASIGDAVIATHRDGSIAFMNGVAEDLTGWVQTEASDRRLTEVFVIVNEETRQPGEDPVARVLRTGAVVGLANHTLLISRDGREIPIDDSAAPIRDRSGEIAGVVLIFRDVTECRASEQAAERARVSLERTNEELQQFAYAVSHDLQEPLRNVTIYTQLLGRRYSGKLDSDAEQYIGFAVNGAVRMQMLLKDLLAYTQASDRTEQATNPIDANSVVQNVLSNLQATIDESGATVTYDMLPAIRMEEVHLEQLFQNLIGNGIKYRSEEPPRIHISAARAGNEWTFRVADNGIGIDPRYKDNIFGLFKRLHTSEKYAGTGIGLAICQKTVQKYGGRIWVEPGTGGGSVFCFTTPAEPALKTRAKASAAGQQSTPLPPQAIPG